MVFRRFRVQCTLRVVALGATMYVLFYLMIGTDKYATTLIVFALSIYQMIALMHYVEKTNRDLSRFFLSVRHADFSQTFSSAGRGSTYRELSDAFRELTAEFQRARAEKEEHYHYLQTVVQHVGIGLLAYTQNEEVELFNNSAKRIFGLAGVKTLEQLARQHPELVERMRALQFGQRALIKTEDPSGTMQLAMHATEFKMRGKRVKLVSVQNIHSELEEKELDAWQHLIRVLTHEIMNSVTPIASLASTVNHLLGSAYRDRAQTATIDSETISDTLDALRTIEKRSEALLHFVEAYRNLTRIPAPHIRIVSVNELLQRLVYLLRVQCEEHKIDVELSVEPRTLEISADPDLIEQVVINILQNAIQALAGRTAARISIRGGLDTVGRPYIQVSDNGPGIMKEALDNIFVPFFTTKEYGSGIGLSLSKQIMRMHGGAISVRSTPEVETVFHVRF